MAENNPYLATTKEEVARLLDAAIEKQAGQMKVKKKRVLEIFADNRYFTCMLDHNNSFVNILNTVVLIIKLRFICFLKSTLFFI